MSDEDLLREIEAQRSLMIAAATGGPRIPSVNHEYTLRRSRIAGELARRRVQDPNPHTDLWDWYGKWSSGDLPTYQSRRQYVTALYRPLIDGLVKAPGSERARVFEEPTGWAAVDRAINDIGRMVADAQAEVQFQAVGLACRELLITLAQLVYDVTRYPSLDRIEASRTDAKRMLEAYLAVELAGSSNEVARRHARAALDLANELQHQRTASFREAALCAEATVAVVNITAILSGRRDRWTVDGDELTEST